MSEYLSKGRNYVSQGDRKLLSLGWFSNKYEEAADFFEKGANQLKLAKACMLCLSLGRCLFVAYIDHKLIDECLLFHTSICCQSTSGKEAGDAYIKLAEASAKLESKHDSASAYVEAAKAYQKIDQKSTLFCIQDISHS